MKLSDFDFRIWDNIQNEYVTGDLGLYVMNQDNDYKGPIQRIHETTRYSYEPQCPSDYWIDNAKKYEKDDNSVQIELFTGFYDKNGNKIYEGDILFSFQDCPEEEVFKYKVVLKEGGFYLVECVNNDEEYVEYLISEFWLSKLEIMGNIHENEDLLQ
ncbi:hypothetical protein CHI73_06985 [Campylobacter coli]|nr:hypothetical protein [Campylobacter coli]